MNKQQGALTLLSTVLLLVACLILSIASYKNVFFQAKRAQNEVASRQAQWMAEGGLECAFANIQALKAVPASFTECLILGGGIDNISTFAGHPLLLQVEEGHTQLQKSVKMPVQRVSGAIKSTANLYLNGSFNFFPDPGEVSNLSNEWKCTAIRYKNLFDLFGTLVNAQFDANNLPYIGFPSGQHCASDHYTLSTNSVSATNDDFLQDIDMEPFEDLFDIPRSDWMDLMYDPYFARIPAALGNSKPANGVLPIVPQTLTDCANQIVNRINAGYDLIWVYGHCELVDDSAVARTDLTRIEHAIDNNSAIEGVVLMIQDGIFSVRGSHEFPGMIYHFQSTPTAITPSAAMWGSSLTQQGYPMPAAVSLDEAVYYQSGAFVPLGGYVMDAPGKYAVFGSSMNFKYNRDVIENALKKVRRITWVEGSWHDFEI